MENTTYLLMATGELVDVLLGVDRFSRPATLIALVMLFFALRRAYGNGRIKTPVKQLVLLRVHSFALVVVILLLFGLTALSV